MLRRARFVVCGRVQGVGYRASAVDEALARQLVGWVRNTASGDVEGVVQGEASDVDAFLAWCQDGPRAARVDAVHADDEEVADELLRFEIRR
jgi:acylphosphatase